MVFLRLDDVTGSAEVVVFNSVYAAARELLRDRPVLVVKGRVDHKQEGETKLIAIEVSPFEATPERREVRLKLDARTRAGRDHPRARRGRAGLPGRGAGRRRDRRPPRARGRSSSARTTA